MRRAFTLLELLLVLAIIALGSAVVAVRLGGLRPAQAVDQAAQQILDQTWRCRQLARSQGAAVRLRVEPALKTATVQVLGISGPTDPTDAQPAEIVLFEGADTITASYLRDDGVASTEDQLDVLFRPDGRCDPPGVLTLACGDHAANVRYPAGLRPPLREIAAVTP